ncbi:MAG: ABC transporter permease [Anaerolineales bacterium]|nr:ABC transporter permease [Anaerolineales bacterium]
MKARGKDRSSLNKDLGSSLDSFKSEGQFKRVLRALFKDKAAVFGLIIFIIMSAMALLAPVFHLADPTDMEISNRAAKPTLEHLMGTDFYGRDVLSRIVWGSRISLIVGVFSVFISISLGVPIGLVAAYLGGLVDSVFMRLMDSIYAFPPLLLAIVVVSLRGPGIINVMLAIGLVNAPDFARLVRVSALCVMEQDYILAARALGIPPWRQILLHILPNASAPLLVRATMQYACAILAESGLSFLGLGTQPPTPTWGSMLNEARGFLLQAPWYPFFPGMMIVIAVLSLTLLGDGLTLALDPRQTKR